MGMSDDEVCYVHDEPPKIGRWEKVPCEECGCEHSPWRTQDECPAGPYICSGCIDQAQAYSKGYADGLAAGNGTQNPDAMPVLLRRIAKALETQVAMSYAESPISSHDKLMNWVEALRNDGVLGAKD